MTVPLPTTVFVALVTTACSVVGSSGSEAVTASVISEPVFAVGMTSLEVSTGAVLSMVIGNAAEVTGCTVWSFGVARAVSVPTPSESVVVSSANTVMGAMTPPSAAKFLVPPSASVALSSSAESPEFALATTETCTVPRTGRAAD